MRTKKYGGIVGKNFFRFIWRNIVSRNMFCIAIVPLEALNLHYYLPAYILK